jgi:hypothetical protein
MRFAALVMAIAVLGCGGKKATRSKVDPDFDAFEAQWVAEGELLLARAREQGTEITEADLKGIREYPGIFVGKGGVFVGRTAVARLDELESKRDAILAAARANLATVAAVRVTPTVVFDLEEQPAAVVVTLLRMFDFEPMTFEMALPAAPDGPPMPSETLCNELRVRTAVTVDPQVPTLSVTLMEKAIWLGLSRFNEFQEMPDMPAGEPDFEKLRYALKDKKSSALFADRRDIEIAAVGGTAGEVLRVLWTTCAVGFTDVAVLPANELSAKLAE